MVYRTPGRGTFAALRDGIYGNLVAFLASQKACCITATCTRSTAATSLPRPNGAVRMAGSLTHLASGMPSADG
jgi:hypothetical protein